MSPPSTRSIRLLAPATVGAAIGIDTVLAALVLIKPPPGMQDKLTVNGVQNMRPERDTFVYLAAGLLSVLASVVLARMPGIVRLRPGRAPRWLPLVAAGGTIGAATAAFVHVRQILPLSASAGHLYLAVSLALGGLCVLAVIAARTAGSGEVAASSEPEPPRPSPKLRFGVVDVAVFALVVGVVYLPGWRLLAGNAFAGEASLHLDFFAFGPALVFRAGGALGTDLHSYYGVGWPVVFSLINPLSYGHIIRLEVVYGCMYYCGVYVLLRILAGDRRWALGGTALAILFQLFSGWPAGLVLWRFPSATVMRWPFDVWCFLACALHLRTRRTTWLVVAAGLVGAAVVFQTDTGLALGLAFAFFVACLWAMDGRRCLAPLAWSAAASLTVVVVGLGVASRWTMLSSAFRDGWLENLRLSAGGATFLPLTTAPPTRSVILFVGIAATYLAVFGGSTVLLNVRRLSADAVMLGCVALYGFLTLLYFVGRSHPYNLFRPTVPFAILIAAGGGIAHREWAGRRRAKGQPTVANGVIAWAAMCTAAVMLGTHPGAEQYRGLIRAAVTDEPPRGICLFENPDDVCGLAPESQHTVDELRRLAGRLRGLGSARRSVAVLDEIGPLIVHMAGGLPWGRYQPAFAGIFTKDQVEAVRRDLDEDPPAFVVMRAESVATPYYIDIWRELRPAVEDGYVRDSRHGVFEIWSRKDAPLLIR